MTSHFHFHKSQTIETYKLKNDIARCLSDSEGDFTPETWREISILDFIYSSLPDECKVSGLTHQSVVQVITSRASDLKWREAVDSDNQKHEDIFSSAAEKEYVRTDGDIRKLYEMRPAVIKKMTLGQFASEYRLLYPSKTGYEVAKSTPPSTTKLYWARNDTRLEYIFLVISR